MTISPSKTLIHHLIQTTPELQQIYNEHLNEYGELLPHVLLGDITRLLLTWVEQGSVEKVSTLIKEFEQQMQSGEPEVMELLSVSFLENLIDVNEPTYTQIKSLMGEKLLKELESYE